MAVSVLIVLSGAAALLAYSWSAVDRLELDRERMIVARVLDRTRVRIGDEIRTATIWDDAFRHTQSKMDYAWVNLNFGEYFTKYFGHDVVLAFGPDGRATYYYGAGRQRDPAAVGALVGAITPAVRRIQARELAMRFGPDGKRHTQFQDIATASGVVRAGDQVYVLALSTITTDSHTIALNQPPHQASVVLVTGRKLGAAFLDNFRKDVGVIHPVVAEVDFGGKASVPLPGLDGRPAARIAWSPDRPGAQVLREAGGWVAIGGALLLVASLALVLRIRGVFSHLQAKDDALARTLEQLTEAKEKAEAANVAKSQFLANMSHEIRTPLNGVLGMAQAMALGELSPPQAEKLQVIQSSGESLLFVLNDILDISKIEAGKLDLHEAPFDLTRLLEGAAATFVELAAAKGVQVRVEVAPAARGSWVGDAERIRQIISNLVSNGVKFTQAGAVRIRALVTDGRLAVEVSDNGIGISDEAQAQLFQKFAQVDGSATRRFGGTGLGLAISRELARMMGGDISVRSRLGEGATFIFAAPLERAESGALPAEPEVRNLPPRALKVLAAEDNDTNRRVLQALLQPIEARITFARDGQEAVEAFERASFDLILMDVQMPVMDGVEACRRIRALERSRGDRRTPMLGLTANVLVHQLQQYRAAGMDECVVKPVVAERLYAAMAQAVAPLGEAA